MTGASSSLVLASQGTVVTYSHADLTSMWRFPSVVAWLTIRILGYQLEPTVPGVDGVPTTVPLGVWDEQQHEKARIFKASKATILLYQFSSLEGTGVKQCVYEYSNVVPQIGGQQDSHSSSRIISPSGCLFGGSSVFVLHFSFFFIM